MKKILSIFLVSLIILGSLCFGTFSASASIYSDWVLGENAEYLTHEGDTYYPIFTTAFLGYGYYAHYSTTLTTNLDYVDEETKEKYNGSTISVSTNTENYCVEIDLEDETDFISVIYVREDCMEEYERLLLGYGEGYYVNSYTNGTMFDLSKEEVDSYMNSDIVTISVDKLYQYDMNELFVYDKTKHLSMHCGYVLIDVENNEAYILHYSQLEYEKLYSVDDTVTVYRIEDSEKKDALIECFNTPYEDELEWMAPAPININLIYAVGIAVFCVLPAMILALSIVMFFVLKNRSYRRGFVVMGVGSAIMIISFVLMLILI